MSVVHLRSRTTADQKEFGQQALSDQSLVYVSDLHAIESFSIELTVGEGWSERYGQHDVQMMRIDAERGLIVGRAGSVVIEAGQLISVPHNMYGIVVPTGRLFLDRGLIIAAAKIEPAFEGSLKLRVFNTGSSRQRLKIGDKLASAIFFTTETTRFHDKIVRRSELAAEQRGRLQALRHWASVNRNQIITWCLSAFTSSVSAALIAYFLLSKKV